jgi:prepilin-type N-terminal cleavage/methylation domain-containing protein
MRTRCSGFSLLEILVGVAVLAALAGPLYGLLSSQQREMLWSSRESELYNRMVTVLLEEEARLQVTGFPRKVESRTETFQLGDLGCLLDVEQVLTMSPTATRGLVRIDVALTATEGRSRTPTRCTMSRYVVDREAAAFARGDAR